MKTIRAYALGATMVGLIAGATVAVLPITSEARERRGLATAPDTQHVTIAVAGMFCESCEASVRAMLKRTKGVYKADVDVKRGLATVSYNPKQTTPRALADVINRLGYKATLPTEKKPG